MPKENDIIATATGDAPEILDTDALDAITGAVKYGGTNTCEPVRRRGGLNDLFITSYSTSGSAD